MISDLNLDDYNYSLENNRIAKYPKSKRDDSKLLVCKEGKLINQKFYNIDKNIPSDSSVFFNNSKVINARLIFKNRNNAKIEILVINLFNKNYKNLLFNKKKVIVETMIKNIKKWKENETIEKANNDITLKVKQLNNNKVIFTWNKNKTWLEILEIFGKIPLPPYLKRDSLPEDLINYQTIYSKDQGSIASPTAGLHFTKSLINKMNKNFLLDFITLHIGIGTFKPVTTKDINQHNMHSEVISFNKKNIINIYNSNNITAVGTTSMRFLESIYLIGQMINEKYKNLNIEKFLYNKMSNKLTKKESMEEIINYMEKNKLNIMNLNTSIFILPGYNFKICDQLITNFHYPKSTLILLIAAFIGEDWKKLYKFAIKNNYRFLSYGDSSLLFKK